MPEPVTGPPPRIELPDPGSISSLQEAFDTRRWPPDEVIDAFLPDAARLASSRYWTPVAVAAHAAGWLDEFDIRTVVDIGSGPGKFCVVASLAGKKPRRLIGLEQRPRLVIAARALADRFEVSGEVRFIEGVLGECPLPAAQAYYLFNPFGENVFCAGDPFDEEVELSEARLERDVAKVELLLRDSPGGTFLLTYHGFGGKVPEGFVELRTAGRCPHLLRLFQKR